MHSTLAQVLEPKHEFAVNFASLGAAGAATGAGFLGLQLNDWLAIAGIGVQFVIGLYWLARLYFKVRRERAALALAKPPETTDAAAL